MPEKDFQARTFICINKLSYIFDLVVIPWYLYVQNEVVNQSYSVTDSNLFTWQDKDSLNPLVVIQ